MRRKTREPLPLPSSSPVSAGPTSPPPGHETGKPITCVAFEASLAYARESRGLPYLHDVTYRSKLTWFAHPCNNSWVRLQGQRMQVKGRVPACTTAYPGLSLSRLCWSVTRSSLVIREVANQPGNRVPLHQNDAKPTQVKIRTKTSTEMRDA